VSKSKFTNEQIAFALKQAELGVGVEEVCRKMGISDATFYMWRKKNGGIGPVRIATAALAGGRRHKRKQIVADLSLDKALRMVQISAST
jgi:putative transposase